MPLPGSEEQRLCQAQQASGGLNKNATASGECCRLYDIGCPAPFDCFTSASGTWEYAQKAWCCRAENLGCAQTCDVAPALMGTRQADYCCDRKGVGCSAAWQEKQAREDADRVAEQHAAGVARRDMRVNLEGLVSELVANPKKVLRRLRWALLAASVLLQKNPSRLIVRALAEATNTTRVSVPQGWNMELLAEERAAVQQWFPSSGRGASVLAQTGQAQDKLYVDYAVTGTSDAEVLQAVQQIDAQLQTGSLGGKGGPEVRTLGTTSPIDPPPMGTPPSSSSDSKTWVWVLVGSLGAVCLGVVIAAVVVHQMTASRPSFSATEMDQGMECLNTNDCADSTTPSSNHLMRV